MKKIMKSVKKIGPYFNDDVVRLAPPIVRAYVSRLAYCGGGAVPTDTGTHDIPEHFCLIPERVILVLE